MPPGACAHKSFDTAEMAEDVTGKRRESHAGPTTVAIAVQPKKRRRLSSRDVYHQETCATTNGYTKSSIHTGGSCIYVEDKRCSQISGRRLGSRLATGQSTAPATFCMLPTDIQARVLYSGYFNSVYVLTNLSLVSKGWHAMASKCYHELDLSRLPHLDDNHLSRMASRFQGVHSLDLSFCDSVGDSVTMALTRCNTTLIRISLRGCGVSDQGLQEIFRFTRLESVDVSKRKRDQSTLLTDDGLRPLAHLRHLQEVNLAWNRLITDEGVRILLSPTPGSKNLRVLDLSCCERLTDAVCEALVGQPLEALSLSGCPQITDQALRILYVDGSGNGDSFFSTGLLEMQAFPRDVNERVHCAAVSYSSTALPQTGGRGRVGSPQPAASLVSLSLAHCPALTDLSVEILLTYSRLQSLDMRDCRGLTENARSMLQKWLPGAMVACS